MTIDVETNDISNVTNSTSANIINNNFKALKDGLKKAFNKNNVTDNELNTDIDMDGNDILNVNQINGLTIEEIKGSIGPKGDQGDKGIDGIDAPVFTFTQAELEANNFDGGYPSVIKVDGKLYTRELSGLPSLGQSDFVFNGNFNDTSVWALTGVNTAIGGGILSFGEGSSALQTLNGTFIEGETYQLSYEVKNYVAGDLELRLLLPASGPIVYTAPTVSSNGVKTEYFVAGSEATRIQAREVGTSSDFDIDNISIRQVLSIQSADGEWWSLGDSSSSDGILAVDRTDLITKNTSDIVLLQEAGRVGIFQYDASVTVAVHSLDTEQGVYVAPDNGSDGAWVRAVLGSGYNVSWFGAVGDGVANDTAAIQAGIDFLSDVTKGGKLLFDVAIYDVDASLNVLSGGIYFIGQGSGYDGGTDIGSPTIIKNNTNTNAIFRYGDGGTTIVRGGGVRDIRLDCDSNSIGVLLDDFCTHLSFEDMLIDFPTVGYFNGQSGFSNTWTRCIVRDYTSLGWDITELCHSNTLIACRTTSGSSATGIADIRIGNVAHCSQVNITNCSFDHWGVGRHILIVRGRGININGNYFEAKDTNMSYPIEVGTIEEIAGCTITGNRFLGVVGVTDAIRFTKCAGFFVAGNEFVVFDTACILNSNADNSGLIGANDFNGIAPLRQSALSLKISIISGDLVGFYGKLGISKPSVTGSRGGNVALLNLLTQLDALGLIENNSTP